MSGRPTREGAKGAWDAAHTLDAPLVSRQAAEASPDLILRLSSGDFPSRSLVIRMDLNNIWVLFFQESEASQGW